MPKPNTERADPLAAVGLKPKTFTSSSTSQSPELVQAVQSTGQATQSAEPRISQPARELKADEERATEKVTAYFTPPQYDRIEELRRQYRKRTGKRISVNELLRRLVEHANIEDILV